MSKTVSSNLSIYSGIRQSLKSKPKKKPVFLIRSAESEVKELENGIEIFITVRLPGLNDMIAMSKAGRGKFNQYARSKDEIEQYLCLTIGQLKIRSFSQCLIGLTWIEPDRKRDIDNISAGKKYILDSLVSMGVLKDDSWKYVKGFLPEYFEADKNNWGVKVRIEEV